MVKDLRSNSLNAFQCSIRLSLPVFSVIVVFLYSAILYLENSYPRINPYHPKKLVYVCFPKEDSFVATYMRFLSCGDLVLSILLAVPCIILGISNLYPRLHWPIALISAARFIIVLVEIVHVSSFHGDTQLDFILSVFDGTCKVDKSQEIAFKAMVVFFTLRCVKGYITINMATLAYGNSLLICLFGLESEPERRRHREHSEEHELEEFPTHHSHLAI